MKRTAVIIAIAILAALAIDAGAQAVSNRTRRAFDTRDSRNTHQTRSLWKRMGIADGAALSTDAARAQRWAEFQRIAPRLVQVQDVTAVSVFQQPDGSGLVIVLHDADGNSSSIFAQGGGIGHTAPVRAVSPR